MTFGNGTLIILQRGSCIQQKCRYCSYDGNNDGISNCDLSSGLSEGRVCIYPGSQVSYYSQSWHNELYYTDPTNVWWAIFFPFVIITITMECAVVFFQYKNGSKPKVAKNKDVIVENSIELQTKSNRDSEIQQSQPPPGFQNNNYPSQHLSEKKEIPPSYEESLQQPIVRNSQQINQQPIRNSQINQQVDRNSQQINQQPYRNSQINQQVDRNSQQINQK